MTTTNIENVVAKVQKLLALANANANENEMKAAVSAANKLMQEHRITEAMLEAQGEKTDDPMVSVVVHTGGRRTEWRERLLGALCRSYQCVWFYSTGRDLANKGHTKYTCVGRKSDVATVEYFLTYLGREVERLSSWHSKGKGVGYARSWMSGCASGIAAQFDDERAKERAERSNDIGQSAALVSLDKRTDDAQAHMAKTHGRMADGTVIFGGTADSEARGAGYRTGRKVSIVRGIDAGASVNSPVIGS